MHPLVSVIIPTVGRPSLNRAVDSVFRQNVPVEVVIVDDSGQAECPQFECPDVRVVRTDGRVGAAAARNLGMQEARGTLLAFLDDDDVWLDGHLTDAVDLLDRRPDCDIYAACGLVLDEHGRGRVEPAVLLGERTVADYLYGPGAWRSRCRRILTPTLVFRNRLADHRMEPGRAVHEDTWWLLTAEREHGAVVVQSPHVGVLVNGSSERTTDRWTAHMDGWLDDVEGIRRGAAATELLTMVGRDAIRSGRPDRLLPVVRDVSRREGGWRWLPVLAAHVGAAGASAGARAAKTVVSGRGLHRAADAT